MIVYHNISRIRLPLRASLLALALGLAASQAQAQGSLDRVLGQPPQGYDDPTELVEVFEQTLAAGDVAAALRLLGLDPVAAADTDDFDERFASVAEMAADQVVVSQLAPDRLVLLLGREVWPFPFPIVMTDGTWTFSTEEGLEEVVNRRVGENEIHAIATAREYVNAQELYRTFDWRSPDQKRAVGRLDYAVRYQPGSP